MFERFAAQAVMAAAFIFHFLLPAAGGLAARAWWRRFRAGIIRCAGYPLLTFARLREAADAGPGAAYRFFGRLEALEGRDLLWLRGGDATLRVAMAGERVIFLPAEGSAEFLTVQGWQRISALPEGTKVFVAGRLRERRGVFTFGSTKGEPLLVLFYDGPESTILERAIASGRQRNEYWNQLTPLSLAMGCIVLLFMGTVMSRSPELRHLAPLAFAAGGVPVAPFLPPGLLFFFLYRGMWRRARGLRAERDLYRLPAQFASAGGFLRPLEPDEAAALLERGIKLRKPSFRLPDESSARPHLFSVRPDAMLETVITPDDPARLAGQAERLARRGELIAVVLFLFGLGLNVWLTLRLFAWMLRG